MIDFTNHSGYADYRAMASVFHGSSNDEICNTMRLFKQSYPYEIVFDQFMDINSPLGLSFTAVIGMWGNFYDRSATSYG